MFVLVMIIKVNADASQMQIYNVIYIPDASDKCAKCTKCTNDDIDVAPLSLGDDCFACKECVDNAKNNSSGKSAKNNSSSKSAVVNAAINAS
jgi:hypothetical protein